ncbi:MAG: bifunctional methionine sulfoxide reductase B/A protein [Spirochaetia bacterium]|nr:bifunctional methionine sulfoxide reductase B/A protein [Spirochaetia bacterium]
MLLLLSLPFILFASGKKEVKEKGDVSEVTMNESLEKKYPFVPLSDELKNELTAKEAYVILQKGTERAFVGEYTDNKEVGTYYCQLCDAPLYVSDDKFDSNCGWPSFDDELPGAVTRHADPDGLRTEIVCSTCGGHLGHVFLNEGFTDKNTRHCVNSISMDFRSGPPVARAVFAGGCFWGVEYLMESLDGVYDVKSGYSGGSTINPTYQEVLTHSTGHLEAVEVLYNPLEISYEEITKYFLEIHDPTQANGQGPDIGNQYLSAIFYGSRNEYDSAIKLLTILEDKGYKIATQVRPRKVFYEAEDYHQDYYTNKGSTPYCHSYTKRF